MRLLHLRPDHVRRRAAQGAGGADRCRCEGADERQYLPVRRLSQYCRRHPAGPPRDLSSETIAMHSFEFIRPKDAATAVSTAAQSKTAQQGAEIRFLAGGTTLIDLMKLNVETPVRL